MTIKFISDDCEKNRENNSKGKKFWGFAKDLENMDEWKFFYGTLAEAKEQARKAYSNNAEQSITLYILH